MAIRFQIRPTVPFDWEYLLGRLSQKIRSGDCLVELGASVPEKTNDLAKLCAEVIGIELIPERVPLPPAPNVRYIVDDAQYLNSLPDSSADVIVAAHLIEHLADDRIFLESIIRVLKAGGFALISTPNRKRLTRRVIESFRGSRSFPWWEHVREYDAGDLQSLAREISDTSVTARFDGIGFGLCGGPIWIYSVVVPALLNHFANYWIIELEKPLE